MNMIALRHVRTDRGKQARRVNQKKGYDDTPYGDKYRRFEPSKEDVTGTITAGMNKDALIAQAVIVADRSRHLNKKGRNLKSPKLFTNALSSVAKDNYLLKDARIRRLTPVECERLQGFPDGWTEWGIDENGEKVKISDTQRYKCLGNAVTVNVIDFLGHAIMNSLSGYDPHSWSISNLADRNGQSEPKGTHNDAKATNGASPCPSDLSSQPTEAF